MIVLIERRTEQHFIVAAVRSLSQNFDGLVLASLQSPGRRRRHTRAQPSKRLPLLVSLYLGARLCPALKLRQSRKPYALVLRRPSAATHRTWYVAIPSRVFGSAS